MRRRILLLVMFGLTASTAWGRPEHKQSLKRYYGEAIPATAYHCATCHAVAVDADEKKLADEAPPHNAFGKRLRELAEQLEAEGKPFDLITRLKLVAGEDADGDGMANELELFAGRAPGNAEEVPAKEALAVAVAAQEQFHQQYRWEPFARVKRPAVPEVKQASWVRNPIDAFLAAEHESRGLTPRPEAPRHVLLRRLYLDLIGLPPTREELHAFLDDTSSDAYEQVVDRLLSDPRYGERWGRHWMDVWRYSDWAGWGQQVRDSQPHIWHWRDWIVESLNRDLPYDQMIVQMLAADEAMPVDRDALRATGYLVRNYKLLSREQWMQDTVDHTALAFLGLTVKCARCHDHMYDPITQKEYYRLRAIFEPHQVRTDQVPGQLDTAKDGLPRVYDKDLAAVTYFYHRGDERTPDKEHPLQPGVPAALGGKLSIEEVQLPLEAYFPEKRAFVVDLIQGASRQAISDARSKLETARKKVAELEKDNTDAAKVKLAKAREELQLAELDVPLAAARHASLEATIRVERLGDEGGKQRDAATWSLAAIEATLKQRTAALLDARRALTAAEQASEQAKANREESEKKSAEKPDDAKLKQAAEKSAADATAAEKKLTDARAQQEKAETAAKQPATAEYEPRKQQVYPSTSTGRRLAFARWIASEENPLTARVAVNHIWLRHFGQPLVETVFDFGAGGRAPSHPALVDWLAAELMSPSINPQSAIPNPQSAPWSMKHLHRLIVTSAAYRTESTGDEQNVAIDRDNRLLWQFRSRRVEAEAVRDSLLYVSAQLDPTQGGPEIDQNQGLTSRRRSLYFRHAAEKQMPLLKLFDAAAVTECYQRKESIVPQQALALANSELSLVQARLLARRLAQQCGSDAAEFIHAAYEQILTRSPSAEELAACQAFLDQQEKLLKANAGRLSGTAADPADGGKPSADLSLRVREDLVHALLNHHDFVTVR